MKRKRPGEVAPPGACDEIGSDRKLRAGGDQLGMTQPFWYSRLMKR